MYKDSVVVVVVFNFKKSMNLYVCEWPCTYMLLNVFLYEITLFNKKEGSSKRYIIIVDSVLTTFSIAPFIPQKFLPILDFSCPLLYFTLLNLQPPVTSEKSKEW